MTRDSNVPDAKVSSPDGARIAARPDVLAALKRQAAAANVDVPSKPLAAESAPLNGLDENGHTPGYDLTVARMAARFNRQPVFGRPPAAAWRGDALAQDALNQLSGVKKTNTPAAVVEDDDPTGAIRSVEALKRAAVPRLMLNSREDDPRRRGGGWVERPQPVRKADEMVGVYSVPDRRLLGVVGADKLRDKAKAGDEVVLDGRGGRWFVRTSDIKPLKTPDPAAMPTPKTPSVSPQAVDGGSAQRISPEPSAEPVSKRHGAAVAFIESLGASHLQKVQKSQELGIPGRAFSTGLLVYRRILSPEGRAHVNEVLNSLPADDRRELKRAVQLHDGPRPEDVAKAMRTPLDGSPAGEHARAVLDRAFPKSSTTSYVDGKIMRNGKVVGHGRRTADGGWSYRE